MGDWTKLIVPVVGALMSGVLLHWLKEGGVRRTRRRNLTEELALIDKLREHPEVAARIRRRVEVALEQYEPSTAARQKRRTQAFRWGSLVLALAFMSVAVVTFDVTVESPWTIFVLGVVAATFANGVEWAATRWLQIREQDEAVNATVAPPAATATARVYEPTVTAERTDGGQTDA